MGIYAVWKFSLNVFFSLNLYRAPSMTTLKGFHMILPILEGFNSDKMKTTLPDLNPKGQ